MPDTADEDFADVTTERLIQVLFARFDHAVFIGRTNGLTPEADATCFRMGKGDGDVVQGLMMTFVTMLGAAEIQSGKVVEG